MNALTRITEVRKAKRVTLEQLAERTGLSVAFISRMASGSRTVSVANLEKIAKALGVPPGALLAAPRTEIDERIAKSLEDIARTLGDILVHLQERG